MIPGARLPNSIDAVNKMWEINKAFLDIAIADGKRFVFTSNPQKILDDASGSFFASEVRYLKQFFKFEQEGDLWHGIKIKK